MGSSRSIVLFLLLIIATGVWSHHHNHGGYANFKKGKDYAEMSRKLGLREKSAEAEAIEKIVGKHRRSLSIIDNKASIPFSLRRAEKMLEKAILKIITGNLSTADMLLLKSLNYSLEEVLAIRERELGLKKDTDFPRKEKLKSEESNLYDDIDTRKNYKHADHNSMQFTFSPREKSDAEERIYVKKNNRPKNTYDTDFDFDAYNRQAVVDYENLASKLETQQSWSDPTSLDFEDRERNSEEIDSPEKIAPDNFGRNMEPQVIFKIRYDDSEFDSSSSDEKTKNNRKIHATTRSFRQFSPSTSRQTSGSSRTDNSFLDSSLVSSTPAAPLDSIIHPLGQFHRLRTDLSENNLRSRTTEAPTPVDTSVDKLKGTLTLTVEGNSSAIDNTSAEGNVSRVPENEGKRISEYEGLEWVEDDVYRVIPEIADSLGYDSNDENETYEYDNSGSSYRQESFVQGKENDTAEYQNDTPDSVKLFMANMNFTAENLSVANLSAYQQLALAHRRDQGQKAIEDIKSRVLALTGRFNHSTNTNQVQRERLTMFYPTCQIPRNTDLEAWSDQFSMNMHFQLNLTFGDHVVAAKLRIYKLPQENVTSSTSGTFDEDEDDEKKIRISIYYYTKSLKKHRSKKRLMDSVVTPLSTEGSHLALDVRQGLKFWRLNPRNVHGNGSNHGLVIQVEDQDGRPLKPALYIQEPSCSNHASDQKAYQRLPALFLRACARYVRIVNGEEITYVNCRH